MEKGHANNRRYQKNLDENVGYLKRFYKKCLLFFYVSCEIRKLKTMVIFYTKIIANPIFIFSQKIITLN